MTWTLKDPASGDEIIPGNTTASTTGFLFDVTHFGIRKGGRRFYSLEGQQLRARGS